MFRRTTKKRTLTVLSGLALVVASAGCLTWSIKKDPYYDSFFEKTSLIMTEEEIEIYLDLPDKESKASFIEEFWKLRDPDPDTEENENKVEFERRIAFANRWFDVAGGCFGQEIRRGNSYRPWGWNTDRGRAYLVMGSPDEVCYTIGGLAAWQSFDPEDGRLLCQAVGWRYLRYRGTFYFGIGRLLYATDGQEENTRLEATQQFFDNYSSVSSNSEAMKRAKLDMISSAGGAMADPNFRIKVDYEDGGLKVRVPVRSVSFEETDGRLVIQFSSRVIVYCRNSKADDFTTENSFSFLEDEARRMKYIEFLIPYPNPPQGRCLFDVIVGYVGTAGMRKTREYVKKSF